MKILFKKNTLWTFVFFIVFSATVWAQDVICEFTKLPDQVVENEEFEVYVQYEIPQEHGANTIHCEMKDTSHHVLKDFSGKVSGKGTKKFSFVAPKLSEKDELIMAVWLCEDWRTPLVPIQFSDVIKIVKKSIAEERTTAPSVISISVILENIKERSGEHSAFQKKSFFQILP